MNTPVPTSPAAWLTEIAAAYRDAREALPSAELLGESATEKDLWEIAPHVCLKFRGARVSKANVKCVTEAAMSSFVATEEIMGDLTEVPQMAFAFAYVASHFGLDLLTEDQCFGILEYVEDHLEELVTMTESR